MVVMVFALCGSCLALALWVGIASHHQLTESLVAINRADSIGHAVLQQQIDSELVALRAKGTPISPVPFGFAHGTYVGHYSGPTRAILPASPLTMLAVGQTDVTRSAIRIAVDRHRYSTVRDPIHPYSMRTGRFDVAFVVIYLVPLLVLALSLTIVSGEREAGTLALLLVHHVTPLRLAVAKVLVRAGVVIGLVTLMVALAFLLRSDVPGLPPGVTGVSDVGARFTLWIAGVMLYSAFWFALALVIDARGGTTSGNALRFTSVWLVLVVMVPSLVSVATRSLRPVPTRALLDEALATSQQAIWGMPSDSVIARLVRKHRDVPASTLVPESLERFMAYQMFTLVMKDSVVAPVRARFATARAERRKLGERLTYLSPALVLSSVLTEAAGTGEARFADYDRQVEAFRGIWTGYFAPRIYHRVPITDLSVVPRFTYAEEPISRVVRRASAGLALLAALTAICVLFALRRYRRYDVVA
jgi:ABC-2 type transport system permease protein